MQDFGTGCGGAQPPGNNNGVPDTISTWDQALKAQGWIQISQISWIYPRPIHIEYVISRDGTTHPITANPTALDWALLIRNDSRSNGFSLYGSGAFPPSWHTRRPRPFGQMCLGSHSGRIQDAGALLEMMKHVLEADAYACNMQWDRGTTVRDIRTVGRGRGLTWLERMLGITPPQEPQQHVPNAPAPNPYAPARHITQPPPMPPGTITVPQNRHPRIVSDPSVIIIPQRIGRPRIVDDTKGGE